MACLINVIDEVLEEHELLWKRLEEVNETIEGATKSDVPEERFRSLKLVMEAFMKYYSFAGEMQTHEMKEEQFLFQYIDEGVQRKLKKQHEEMQAILNEGRKALEDFRNGKISINKLRDKMKKFYGRAKKLLKEHRSIEDRVFINLRKENLTGG